MFISLLYVHEGKLKFSQLKINTIINSDFPRTR